MTDPSQPKIKLLLLLSGEISATYRENIGSQTLVELNTRMKNAYQSYEPNITDKQRKSMDKESVHFVRNTSL